MFLAWIFLPWSASVINTYLFNDINYYFNGVRSDFSIFFYSIRYIGVPLYKIWYIIFRLLAGDPSWAGLPVNHHLTTTATSSARWDNNCRRPATRCCIKTLTSVAAVARSIRFYRPAAFWHLRRSDVTRAWRSAGAVGVTRRDIGHAPATSCRLGFIFVIAHKFPLYLKGQVFCSALWDPHVHLTGWCFVCQCNNSRSTCNGLVFRSALLDLTSTCNGLVFRWPSLKPPRVPAIGWCFVWHY